MGDRHRLAELKRETAASLEALGLSPESPAHDGWLDGEALAAALAGDEPVLLRAYPPLGAQEAGYAPAPSEPVWVALSGEGARTSPFRRAEPSPLAAESVRVTVAQEPWPEDARGVPKVVATVHLGDLVICEAAAADADEARARVAAVASALSRRLALPLEPADLPAVEPALGAEPLSAEALVRWGIRREGGRFVLRDYASRGPREAAAREWISMVLLAVGGAVAGHQALGAYRERAWEDLAITGAIAFVLSLAAFAWFHIARHSSRYRARSEALFVVGHGRFVVAPWHARSGAVDENPEGRYGAAIALQELEEMTVVDGGATLRLGTSHGPIDVGTLESERAAARWKAALLHLIETVRQAPKATKAKKAMGTAALALLLGCSPAPEPLPPPLPTAAAAPIVPAGPAATPTAAAPAPVPAPPPSLALIDDDLTRARSLAREGDKPLFVEVWAPWCHTCLSMKSFVLPDPAIAAFGDRVVFAAIDSDRPENADFMQAHEVNVWPTLFVFDANGELLGLWQGAASVRELRDFLQGALDAREADRQPNGALAAMLEAKRAHAKGAWLEAANHYRRALERGGPTWTRRSEALAGLLFSEYRQKHWERCAQLGAKHAAEIEGAAVPTDFCWSALACAKQVTAAPIRESVETACQERLARHTESPPLDASVDDRSDALSLYADLLHRRGDAAASKRAVETQLALLEAAAAAAPSPKEASTFDYARLNAYLRLGRGDEAVKMLEARTRELPDSYEPHARLAQALMAVGRDREAVAPLDRALDLSYGPRRIGYLATKAELMKTIGDRAEEKATLEALVTAYEALDEALQARHRERAETARRRLRQLGP